MSNENEKCSEILEHEDLQIQIERQRENSETDSWVYGAPWELTMRKSNFGFFGSWTHLVPNELMPNKSKMFKFWEKKVLWTTEPNLYETICFKSKAKASYVF